MRKEIEKALVRLEIEGKETRKETARGILIILALGIFFLLVPYFYSQLQVLSVVGMFILLIGVVVISGSYPALYQSLIPEHNAFKKIARAIEILEKSKEHIAYEEAYRCVKSAHKTLTKIELNKDLEWYDEINETLEQFLEDLELIVLPAISNSNIKTEHLEEIALAILSTNQSELEAVTKTLESESSYTKQKPALRKIRIFARRFRESRISNILYSLAFGYGAVLIICLVYVVATQQDFIVFARERPDIVVLGGLFASGLTGITVWRIR